MKLINLLKKRPQYIKAAVYGANDGMVTTFAVVAGAAGAGLSPAVVIILGGANVLADGLSMGLGDFLGERSERRIKKTGQNSIPSWHTGLITFLFFFLAGLLPLLPYFWFWLTDQTMVNNLFWLSSVTTALTMFAMGSLRTLVTKGNWLYNGLEMLAIGSIAASVAYFAGEWLHNLL